MIISLIILFSILGSVGSIALAAVFLAFPDKTRRTLIPYLVSYASGTLLGAAFLGLIPHALKDTETDKIMIAVLLGILLFFVLEKLLIWRHCHKEHCEIHGTAGPLLLVGDAFHNFGDGIIIAATFLVSTPLGIATSLTVIAHEIPQEVGDFAILIDSGYGKAKAFIFNSLSGMTTLVGAVLAYFFLREVHTFLPYIMALSASSFIYIATADLIPGLNRSTRLIDCFTQLILMLAGIVTIAVFHLGHAH